MFVSCVHIPGLSTNPCPKFSTELSQTLIHEPTGRSTFPTQCFLQDPVSAQHGWKALRLFPVFKAAQGALWHLLSSAITPSWIHAQHTEDVCRVRVFWARLLAQLDSYNEGKSPLGGTYLTIVLRNQGLLTMDGTASSISGCVLMKFRVSSGNSLEVTYFSNDVEPAQQPGLNKTRG